MQTTTNYTYATVAGPHLDFPGMEQGLKPVLKSRLKTPQSLERPSIFELVNQRIRRAIGEPTPPPPPPSWGTHIAAVCKNPIFQGTTLGCVAVGACLATPVGAAVALAPFAPWFMGLLFLPSIFHWMTENKRSLVGGLTGAGIATAGAYLLGGAAVAVPVVVAAAVAGALAGFWGVRYHKQLIAFAGVGFAGAHFAGAGQWSATTAAATSNPGLMMSTAIFLGAHAGHIAAAACAISAAMLVYDWVSKEP